MELLDAGGLVGHLVPEGSVYSCLAEHRRRLFSDDMFAHLFPSPHRVALAHYDVSFYPTTTALEDAHAQTGPRNSFAIEIPGGPAPMMHTQHGWCRRRHVASGCEHQIK